MKNKNQVTAFVVAATFMWNNVGFAAGIHAEEIISSGQEIRMKLNQQLESEQVTAELEKMGVQKTEARMRLAAMTDSELQQISKGMERQAGGEVIVIGVTAALLILLLIILLIRPFGHSSGATTGGSTTVIR